MKKLTGLKEEGLQREVHEEMLRGRISGFDTKDYILPGKAGQTMALLLETSNRYAYFTLSADNGRRLAGETKQWSGKLPGNGFYRIRVVLKGVEAKRGGVADYMISVEVFEAAKSN